MRRDVPGISSTDIRPAVEFLNVLTIKKLAVRKGCTAERTATIKYKHYVRLTGPSGEEIVGTRGVGLGLLEGEAPAGGDARRECQGTPPLEVRPVAAAPEPRRFSRGVAPAGVHPRTRSYGRLRRKFHRMLPFAGTAASPPCCRSRSIVLALPRHAAARPRTVPAATRRAGPAWPSPPSPAPPARSLRPWLRPFTRAPPPPQRQLGEMG